MPLGQLTWPSAATAPSMCFTWPPAGGGLGGRLPCPRPCPSAPWLGFWPLPDFAASSCAGRDGLQDSLPSRATKTCIKRGLSSHGKCQLAFAAAAFSTVSIPGGFWYMNAICGRNRVRHEQNWLAGWCKHGPKCESVHVDARCINVSDITRLVTCAVALCFSLSSGLR